MQPQAHHPSTFQEIQHWLAHTVHWGDAPTWFASVGGAVAAFYAIRGFRIQRRQVADLAAKQALTDNLLAYQAHSYARALTADVSVEWSPTNNPDERFISLKNRTKASIHDIEVHAVLGGNSCTILDEARALVNVDAGSLVAASGWASPFAIAASESFGTVIPQCGVTWTVHADGAVEDDQLAYTIQFSDEVGGRWMIDHADRVSLLNGPAT